VRSEALHERPLREGPRDPFAPASRRVARPHIRLAGVALAALGLVEALAFAGVAGLAELGVLFSTIVAVAALVLERPDDEEAKC
jgi:hypothetical protein